MEMWNKGRSFAEETAKRTQDLTKEVAKRSQELSFGAGASRFSVSDIIAETTKRSKEIAAQASKRADLIRAEATKHLAAQPTQSQEKDLHLDLNLDLESFGINEELREFVKGITITTFSDFPLQDDTEFSDVPAVSNVRQDLTQWQEKHANLVLSTVKEISRLRYELCPRVMKERKFWRIYFILVNSHITLYENRYMEGAKLKSSEQVKDHKVMEPLKVELTSNDELQEVKKETKTSTSSTEQDLDVFLLGDTGDSDDDPDDSDGGFDDDLDKLVDSSDDEKGKS